MVDSADANNAYYDINDSFIHDTQSSHQGYLTPFPQGYNNADEIVFDKIG